ncbi:hypothetical protein TanjilG_13809 [Lupinus angustifolius]|uniref:Uncharacterized protein n=1 Tax=Lupinus angustifolius TaxID=3871 RepID=A0A1J7GVS7_LUPAN|nr:hypothetical protein TanjilG_13809 [Lupinus angustifolius]
MTIPFLLHFPRSFKAGDKGRREKISRIWPSSSSIQRRQRGKPIDEGAVKWFTVVPDLGFLFPWWPPK